jgi:hypothetical protein
MTWCNEFSEYIRTFSTIMQRLMIKSVIGESEWEQDGKIDTLQCLHESLQRKVVDQHPSFPLLDTPANATILLDQSVPPPSMSPLPSTLPNLINLDMSVMESTPLTVEDGSAMVGLMLEPSQVQPEGPQSSCKIVVLDEPANLFPEYNSADEMLPHCMMHVQTVFHLVQRVGLLSSKSLLCGQIAMTVQLVLRNLLSSSLSRYVFHYCKLHDTDVLL